MKWYYISGDNGNTWTHQYLTNKEAIQERDNGYIVTENPNLPAALTLWRMLEDVPMNPVTEEMDFPFLHFPAGTHREEIWHWFESTFGVSVARDLMHL